MSANSYLLTADGKTAVAVDCGGEGLWEYALSKGLKIEYLLLTHGHYDHIAGCAALAERGVKIGAAEKEVPLIRGKGNLALLFGASVSDFPIDFTFSDNDVLTLCGMEIEVIATPGHTAGGVCFKTEKNLFTGDTLFCGSVGRTDFPTGDASALKKSIRERLFALDGNFSVYPGHEEESSLDYERKFNPYIR